MSKAVDRRLRRMERRTLMPLSALDRLPPDERDYVAKLFAATRPGSKDAVPTDEHLSNASKKRIARAINRWSAEVYAEIEDLERSGLLPAPDDCVLLA